MSPLLNKSIKRCGNEKSLHRHQHIHCIQENSPYVVESFRSFDLIGINCAVLAELYAGFDLGRKSKQNRDELTDFLNSKRVVLFAHDIETAEFFSHIYRQLRSKGSPIPTKDHMDSRGRRL